MTKTLLSLAATALSAVLVLPAQDVRPDFSGTWSFSVAKSDLGGGFGGAPPGGSMVQVIEHKEPIFKVTITVKTAQGEVRTNEQTFSTDGKENSHPIPGGAATKSTTKWNGKKLVTHRQPAPNGVEILVTWELSEDGKVLTVTRDLKTPQGPGTQTLVFSKE